MKENWGRKEAVSISGRDVERTEWGRHRPGLYMVEWGASSVSPGETWGCWLLEQL